MQEHAHCQLFVTVDPSASVRTQVQLKVPSAPEPVFAFVFAPVCVFDQIQFHAALEVGARSDALAFGSGAHVPSHFQFHCQLLPGAETSPGMTIATFVFVPPSVLTMLSCGEEPFAVAVFFWVTVPSLPGLPTLTETFTFFAPVCVVVALVLPREGSPLPPLSVTCSLGSVGAPPCCWSIVCVVSDWFSPSASPVVGSVWSVAPVAPLSLLVALTGATSLEPPEESALFCWETEPLSPELPTRTTAFTFVAPVCVVCAEPGADPPEPHDVAPALEEALFDWPDEPTFPGLSTRTVAFVFVGDDWVVVAPAFAVPHEESLAGAAPLLPCAVPAPDPPESVAAGSADEPAEDCALFDWDVPPLEPGLPTRTFALVFPAADWFDEEVAVELVLDGSPPAAVLDAVDESLFDCVTGALLPAWPVRSDELSFCEPVWSAVPVADAFCDDELSVLGSVGAESVAVSAGVEVVESVLVSVGVVPVDDPPEVPLAGCVEELPSVELVD